MILKPKPAKNENESVPRIRGDDPPKAKMTNQKL